ncbi:MAG: L-serine ammonia-lyase, iron-sulfur-dependent, subunit alpha [Clostridia bacterium]|nr:L-serine ammonia-lyase, iron-sulfur-dependent, subunit alpha [Clostridia bacterium]
MLTVKHLIDEANKNKCKISDIVCRLQSREQQVDEYQTRKLMRSTLETMRTSVKNGLKGGVSNGGLCGKLSKEYIKHGRSGILLGKIGKDAIAYALAAAEHNACMGKIVAAPTAGSCGILPAVLLAAQNEFEFTDEELVSGLLNSAGISLVVAENASISGAKGGCQAECGTASAAAASALTELMGGSPEMCAHACAIAFKFILGLTCDPVAGLVEVPCVKRNASGAVNALVAAELALCGIESVIPADEVISAMKQTGELMSISLKETSQAGLAVTPTALEITNRLGL